MKEKSVIRRGLGVLLAVALLLTVLPLTAMAENGPFREQLYGEWYPAFLNLNKVDENGVWLEEDSFSVFSNDTVGAAPDGVAYDLDTNTLTLTGFDGAHYVVGANMMGDDFTVEAVGDCQLAEIIAYGDGWGGSVTFAGSGTLTVNELGIFDRAVTLYGEGVNVGLHFGPGVKVTLCGQQDVASVCNVPDDQTAKMSYTFANGQSADVTREMQYYDRERSVLGYEYMEADGYSYWSFLQGKNADDPDGLYVMREITYGSFDDDYNFIGEYTVYNPVRLIFSESLDAYVEDMAFAAEHADEFGKFELSEEEMADTPFSFVTNGAGERVEFHSEKPVYSEPSYYTVYVDSQGNEYACQEYYTDEGMELRVYDMQLIPEMPQDMPVYIMTPNETVDPDDLLAAIEKQEDGYAFILKGGSFTYDGSDVPDVTSGDVDLDRDVDAADALMALQAATGKINLTAEQTAAADVDGQSGVTAADALAILQFATGKITAF
ncbi:MAG: dockerin type I repeat-containing protein [Acutalibacteraceae bacterium]|jgi:hypothetical protein